MPDDVPLLGHERRVYFKIIGDVAGVVDIVLGDDPQRVVAVFGKIGEIVVDPDIRAVGFGREARGDQRGFPVDDTAHPGPVFEEDDRSLGNGIGSQKRLVVDDLAAELAAVFHGVAVHSA